MSASKIRIGGLAAAAALLALVAGCHAPDRGTSPSARTREARIVYTANVGGETEPCG